MILKMCRKHHKSELKSVDMCTVTIYLNTKTTRKVYAKTLMHILKILPISVYFR